MRKTILMGIVMTTWMVLGLVELQAHCFYLFLEKGYFHPFPLTVWNCVSSQSYQVASLSIGKSPRGPTLLLLTVVLLRLLRFLPTLPLLGRGMPPWNGHEKQKLNLKGNRDGLKKEKKCLSSISILNINILAQCWNDMSMLNW